MLLDLNQIQQHYTYQSDLFQLEIIYLVKKKGVVFVLKSIDNFSVFKLD